MELAADWLLLCLLPISSNLKFEKAFFLMLSTVFIEICCIIVCYIGFHCIILCYIVKSVVESKPEYVRET